MQFIALLYCTGSTISPQTIMDLAHFGMSDRYSVKTDARCPGTTDTQIPYNVFAFSFAIAITLSASHTGSVAFDASLATAATNFAVQGIIAL